ncbi:MAG: hypothetical protein SOZ90_03655 [Candidatus Faecousia sp.]|nr:hypothetical protein [Candidatus Faecousia sp.]
MIFFMEQASFHWHLRTLLYMELLGNQVKRTFCHQNSKKIGGFPEKSRLPTGRETALCTKKWTVFEKNIGSFRGKPGKNNKITVESFKKTGLSENAPLIASPMSRSEIFSKGADGRFWENFLIGKDGFLKFFVYQNVRTSIIFYSIFPLHDDYYSKNGKDGKQNCALFWPWTHPFWGSKWVIGI